MLTYIKANYKAGDAIEITTSEGGVIGEIEYVNDKFIILRQPNGQICGVAASDIRTFVAKCPVEIVPAEKPVTAPPAEPENDEPVAEVRNAETGVAEDNGVQADNTLINESLAAVSEPKVVGHIDLDRLQRIDPRFNRRRYFKSEDETQGDEDDDANDRTIDANNFHRTPYVSAKGRITYYNVERRYGFIHDYNSNESLYFHIQQVADPRLFDDLRKGTKVVYTVDRNAQGFVARCVHLPKSFDDLLNLAEDELDARHHFTARDLVTHILDVDPEFKPARDLLDEINDSMPSRFTPATQQNPSSQYMPSTLYAQAKRAFLNKDNRKAEDLYKQAIAAGEKVETCIKDLVTLYVSEYKQEADVEVKEGARRKAMDFLNSHRNLLPDTLTNKQFLALNYYLPILDLYKFIELVDEIMADPQVNGVLSRRVFYIWQKAIAYNKLNKVDEALALVEEGLTLAPYNRQLANLKNQILDPEVSAKVEGLILAENADAAKTAPATPDNENAAYETVAEAENEETSAADEADGAALAEAETVPEDGTTGDPKPDSWWDSLKQPF